VPGRVADMMGRTHALSGLVVGVAAGQFIWHLNPAHLAVAAAVTAGAAVLPDIDHPDATCARDFGFVTRAFAWLVEHVSGGHRHGTHSLVGIAAFTGAAYAAEHYRQSLGGKIGLGLLLVLVLASALRALKVGGHFADLLAIAGAAAMLRYGYDVTLVPWAIAAGTATHLAGDMLTNEGIPIAWPLSRYHVRLLPEPLAFTTGTRPERWVVAPLLVVALAWLVGVAEKVLPAGRLPLR
jgi:membrane-bound metal-dependent hydrolase YbcI (DUF457 family)